MPTRMYGDCNHMDGTGRWTFANEGESLRCVRCDASFVAGSKLHNSVEQLKQADAQLAAARIDLAERSSRLDSLRGAVSPVPPVATVTNNNQPGWQSIVETAPNVTLAVGTKLYDQAGLFAAALSMQEQRAAEVIELDAEKAALQSRLDERTKQLDLIRNLMLDGEAESAHEALTNDEAMRAMLAAQEDLPEREPCAHPNPQPRTFAYCADCETIMVTVVTAPVCVDIRHGLHDRCPTCGEPARAVEKRDPNACIVCSEHAVANSFDGPVCDRHSYWLVDGRIVRPSEVERR